MKVRPLALTLTILWTVLGSSSSPGSKLADTETTPALRGRNPYADTTGTLRGRVTFAPDGRAAPYANVIVLGTRRGAQTTEDGGFRITEVPPGTHQLRVQHLRSPQTLLKEIEVVVGDNDVGSVVLNDPKEFDPAPVKIGTRAAVRPQELEATIRPAQRTMLVGDLPKFEVRIHNRGDSPVLLPQSVDASDAWASPRVNIEIEGPAGGFVPAPSLRCGNNNGVRDEDFIEVGPGMDFDPYAGGWIAAKLQRTRFAKPGRYTATFRYVTTETDPRRWMGGPCGQCTVPARLIAMLEQVPAVELTASTTFDVLP